MKLYYASSEEILRGIFDDYAYQSRNLLRHLASDRRLSDFDAFNKRLKIAWGIQIEFTDDLNIKRDVVRDCYRLMLKLADLWFAFEHLSEIANETIPTKKPNSKFDFFEPATMEELGLSDITRHCNQLLWEHVLQKTAWRREIYHLIYYLTKNTKGGTKNTIGEIRELLRARCDLEMKHICAWMYGIRNIYVHKGVTAALGTENYEVKRALYTMLHDTLILYALTLGHAYCRKKLLDYLPDSQHIT